ncbi:rhamnan synthesis F family protein [Microbacterium sp. M3]|uniref:Rhamnan synthesis F family protein n=1 Tax=Microbacterium arthrosphaerae TaxID=792652 RepID=A0ABU4H215_9MICO|nr:MULTISPECIES: rhamnan synthesis F family protein [Microbacterium]MDW4573373.1 rhamnan synthesis F family protein [Microbacterium arthrosphaerae]MDW7607228.1 rhamnan synthesis F family protein [Microbacterium sp. M3]
MQIEHRAAVVEPGPFPADGRRVVFYLLHDNRGDVDDYIVYKLRELRPFAEHIFVVVNGELTAEGRARLDAVADTVWTRANVGFDVWGYKTAMERFGIDRLAEYDELILMNYTWFGPVRSFAPLFERMDQVPAHFWGLTDYGEEIPNPYTRTGILHRHIQSHWIAVRRTMFTSAQWLEYWAQMPMITTYTDSILQHESKFTHHFEELGFASSVAFPVDDYPSKHPALFNADLLMDDGCPALKRRAFFHYPPYLDQHAVIGRWTIEKAAGYGYPVAMMYQNLVKNSPPKALYTDASMMEILPDVDVSYDPSAPLRLAAVVHIFYEEMTDELLDRLVMLPEQFDLFITTTDAEKSAAIQEVVDRRADEKVARYEIRILPSNRGRDLSAFFIACRDVLEVGRYDLVVKIHSKKTVQDSYNAGRYFKFQQLDNVLNSPGYAANAVALFQKESGLGLAFPPMIHIGYPTMGRGWYANKEPAAELCTELGIRVPFDDISPLAPYGCMWFARPEALKILTDREWRYDEYAAPNRHTDGSLAHVQERLIAYAAAELGYHSRTIATLEHTSVSHTALDFKLDQMGATMPGYPIDQIQFLHRAGWLGHGGIVALTRVYLKLNHPRIASFLSPLEKPARAAHAWLWRLRHRSEIAKHREEVEGDLTEGELRPAE